MRISDWSSDVCSSDLLTCIRRNRTDVRIRRGLLIRLCIGVRRGFTVRNLGRGGARFRRERKGGGLLRLRLPAADGHGKLLGNQIGRASCRERVCQYV